MEPEDREPPPTPNPDSNLDTFFVGIDIGLTYTGVSYSSISSRSTPSVVQIWPGVAGLMNKVPTKVEYQAGNISRKAWGFGCTPPERLQPTRAVIDRFKLFLDGDFLRTFEDEEKVAVGSHEDVRRWFTDFLKALYDHITKHLSEKFSLTDWKATTIHFLFSVPTIWDKRAIVKDFQKVVKAAGFGCGAKDHFVEFDLTEAEAAATYTARSSTHHRPAYRLVDSDNDDHILPVAGASPESTKLQPGNILLVCDSGGGTTDISVLRVESLRAFEDGGKEESIALLRTLPFIGGVDSQTQAIGSVQIDEAFQTLVKRRLEPVPSDSYGFSYHLAHAASTMAREKTFQNYKHEFGTSTFKRDLKIPVPGLPTDYTNEKAGIVLGRMIFTKDEIRKLFDAQIVRIFELIDSQLDRPDLVSHFILAGGLGSSQYVQDCIVQRYGPEGRGKQILISDQPQLAVCKGLVIDKIHRLKHKHAILQTRTCRASYGILFNEPFDKQKHQDLFRNQPHQFEKNLLDGELYATDRINWLIRKGEPLHRDEKIRRSFYRMIPTSKSASMATWTDAIVVSKMRPERLPPSFFEGDPEKAGEILSSFALRDTVHGPATDSTEPLQAQLETKKKRNLLGLKKVFGQFWKVKIDVVAQEVGSSGLKFELWCGDKKIGEASDIIVSWVYPQESYGRQGSRGKMDVIVVGRGDEDEESETVVEGLEGAGVDSKVVKGLISADA